MFVIHTVFFLRYERQKYKKNVLLPPMNQPIIQHIAVTGSTNRDLARMEGEAAASGQPLPEFFTVAADFQEAGRGQGSNRWFSDAGENMLCSILFRPPVPASRQFLFNQYFSLTVRRFLLRYLPEVQVKWPNDIYVGDKKIAGILIEHSVAGDVITRTIAGIGLNINQKEFPTSLPNPTSIYLETGVRHDVPALTAEFVAFCKAECGRLSEGQADKLQTEYRSCLYHLGEYRPYAIGGERILARINGVDAYGRLLLSEKGGKEWCCGMKEIVFLSDDDIVND